MTYCEYPKFVSVYTYTHARMCAHTHLYGIFIYFFFSFQRELSNNPLKAATQQLGNTVLSSVSRLPLLPPSLHSHKVLVFSFLVVNDDAANDVDSLSVMVKPTSHWLQWPLSAPTHPSPPPTQSLTNPNPPPPGWIAWPQEMQLRDKAAVAAASPLMFCSREAR